MLFTQLRAIRIVMAYQRVDQVQLMVSYLVGMKIRVDAQSGRIKELEEKVSVVQTQHCRIKDLEEKVAALDPCSEAPKTRRERRTRSKGRITEQEEEDQEEGAVRPPFKA